MIKTYPSVLSIAGFDSSGGAGIQADIKTISALGCYATCALTALPVQNTTGVKNIYSIEEQAVAEQMSAVFEDIFPDAVKIGMIHTSSLVGTIVNTLKKYPFVPVVFDPVMVSTSGHQLIENETIYVIIEELFPIAEIITPNLDEAAVLAKMPIKTVEDMKNAGEKILQLGVKSLLLKGGHLEGENITSLLFLNKKIYTFDTQKYNTRNTHGSGCTLSSAIAAYLAQGKSMLEAVSLAQEYVHKAIFYGKDQVVGKGNGPLNHFFAPKAMKIMNK